MSLALTVGGTDLLVRALAGTADINFTSIKIGSGPDAGSLATDLNHAELQLPIESLTADSDKVILTASFNNNSIVTGFRMTEVGVFATDPDDSSAEIMYAYEYTDPANADFVPPNADRTLETELRILVYVGEAAHVTATIASGIYATQAALDAHIADTTKHITYVVAGRKDGTTLGDRATAEGYETTSSGDYSHAEGRGTSAVGDYSHAEGDNTVAAFGDGAHAEGKDTVAVGSGAHAEGRETFAAASHAEGRGTSAYGAYSHAEGYGGDASNRITLMKVTGPISGTDSSYNVTEGYSVLSELPLVGEKTDAVVKAWYDNAEYTIVGWGSNTVTFDRALSGGSVTDGVIYMTGRAIGEASHVEGCATAALGDHAHAEGEKSIASGKASHAEGGQALASGVRSHAEGFSTVAGGNQSHAEGGGSEASGNSSHAEGGQTAASGDYSHVEGNGGEASGDCSHAEGYGSEASGDSAHAEGDRTKASGEDAHAEGFRTEASGEASHAEGLRTVANHRAQHVFGEYNVEDDSAADSDARGNYVEIVGNGTAINDKSNARTLDWSGNETLAGKLTLGAGPTGDMDAATKQYVDQAIAAAIAAL